MRQGSILGLCLGFLVLTSAGVSMDWGFFAHKLINRMAVFTLPPELMNIYKPNIEYLTAHAVDADKRRYATTHEAVRHYIDLDHFGSFPFENMPREWTSALAHYSDLHLVNEGDTLFIYGKEVAEALARELDVLPVETTAGEYYKLDVQRYRDFFVDSIMPSYYEESWQIKCAPMWWILNISTSDCWDLHVADSLSAHGILPYHLAHQQRQLTQAFKDRDVPRILRLSADMGHYLGDAHVPLHTTQNYNGQLTDQLGIHAFWESRIPELFAEEHYNFFVGKAEYLENPADIFWDVVLESHRLVDSVLGIEKSLSHQFPSDQQYCFSDRNNLTVRTQCPAYATAYQERMDGMVEQRMQQSIQRIGSAWYTAWIDAGQPDFPDLNLVSTNNEEDKLLEESFSTKKINGRKHE